jgi:uncharacterized protein YndB with AHSA1/START domain
MTDTAVETQSVIVEREVPHPRDKVWRALTQSALIEDWLMKNDFEPVVGRHFRLQSQPMPPRWDGIIECEVLAVEPPAKLAYSWASMGLQTVVTLTLSPTATGTHLRMEQAGFPTSAVQNIRGAEYGWRSFLEKLDGVAAGA